MDDHISIKIWCLWSAGCHLRIGRGASEINEWWCEGGGKLNRQGKSAADERERRKARRWVAGGEEGGEVKGQCETSAQEENEPSRWGAGVEAAETRREEQVKEN